MSGYAFTLDDVAYLTGAGQEALAEVAARPLTDAGRVSDIAWARSRFGDRAAVLVETVLLRRRAAAKLAELGDVTGWLFTDEALQQATAGAVAVHRARRLSGRVVHDATCSIGTELAALSNSGVSASLLVGSDLDAVRLAMAQHNVGDRAQLCRADALHPVTRDAVAVVDPARRSSGRRTFDPRDYAPPLDELLRVYRGRDLVVKCAPGVDFGQLAELGFSGEVQITSLAGSVREACLWSSGLTESGVTRRATVLDKTGQVAEEFTDADPDDCPSAPVGRWIVDPDGAVVRAGLVRHYAARHGLWQLDPAIAYLSGDELPSGTRGFEVIEQIAYNEKRLRQALSAHGAAAVEILVRGVDVDPDTLRSKLKLQRPGAQLSVVITRIGTGAAARPTAYICRPSR
ncbi:THUMP-like domain-containing protein [Mycolicibacterium aubagnense]|uniref:S-adenosylmethionine-dependent methyltransferase n=1 Tax=Mycolicibacterium aubagnense TaxID=319707 RepID=A0ABM7I9F2_9MYCO|nr:class I SAM-dependent methyltransferase [Mycolicibacterium aubagnense]TLH60107.1 SAM-dependent methyltransferase [Mycolicibacterium aubagnense]WGI34836.1 class I SAM-dependent methyltransferase [Mycolicibacterium aubagnense]BBX83264.1 S-adenosylmethionine-dependent methyltransferase [Mycolicibacterium aubagnense]